jgi:hypothetical protein
MVRYDFKGKELSWADWTGFGKDENKTVENTLQKDGKPIPTKEIIREESGKTLWDWLGLAGVIAIPIVLFQFQQQQQKKSDENAQAEKRQAEERAKLEKEIADTNLREEALQDYIDKIAELLIDKKLKVLLKLLSQGAISKDDPELDAALDVARARTLSILRRLDKDVERKASVVRFLIDADLIQGLDLLKDADLKGVHLSKANLAGADLSGTLLGGAKLLKANLSEANLSSAKLQNAILIGANLEGANLSKAFLLNAQLLGVNLKRTNLWRASFVKANLCNVELQDANISQTNLQSVKNLTLDQLKNVRNLEEAIYDPDFRNLLGLSPQTVKDERYDVSSSEVKKMLGLPPET